MARTSKGPWFRAAKNGWYVEHGGRQVTLRVNGEGNRTEAVKAWHRLMADGPRVKPGTGPRAGGITIGRLVEMFLADASARLKGSTVAQYRADLDKLTTAFGGTPAGKLTADGLGQWVYGLKVGSTTQAITLRSVSACLGWAERADLLDVNVAKKVRKPKAKSRSDGSVISPEVHTRLMANASPAFGLVLRVLHATGCRPGEAARIAVENFDASAGVARLQDHKTDRDGRPRLIFFPAQLSETMRGLAVRYKSGPLLRTKHGNPWSGRKITEAMQKLKRRAGVGATAYGFRHTYATEALGKGVPDAQVAALLGHSSTAMLHKHYAHLTAQAHVLRGAVELVRG